VRWGWFLRSGQEFGQPLQVDIFPECIGLTGHRTAREKRDNGRSGEVAAPIIYFFSPGVQNTVRAPRSAWIKGSLYVRPNPKGFLLMASAIFLVLFAGMPPVTPTPTPPVATPTPWLPSPEREGYPAWLPNLETRIADPTDWQAIVALQHPGAQAFWMETWPEDGPDGLPHPPGLTPLMVVHRSVVPPGDGRWDFWFEAQMSPDGWFSLWEDLLQAAGWKPEAPTHREGDPSLRERSWCRENPSSHLHMTVWHLPGAGDAVVAHLTYRPWTSPGSPCGAAWQEALANLLVPPEGTLLLAFMPQGVRQGGMLFASAGYGSLTGLRPLGEALREALRAQGWKVNLQGEGYITGHETAVFGVKGTLEGVLVEGRMVLQGERPWYQAALVLYRPPLAVGLTPPQWPSPSTNTAVFHRAASYGFAARESQTHPLVWVGPPPPDVQALLPPIPARGRWLLARAVLHPARPTRWDAGFRFPEVPAVALEATLQTLAQRGWRVYPPRLMASTPEETAAWVACSDRFPQGPWHILVLPFREHPPESLVRMWWKPEGDEALCTSPEAASSGTPFPLPPEQTWWLTFLSPPPVPGNPPFTDWQTWGAGLWVHPQVTPYDVPEFLQKVLDEQGWKYLPESYALSFGMAPTFQSAWERNRRRLAFTAVQLAPHMYVSTFYIRPFSSRWPSRPLAWSADETAVFTLEAVQVKPRRWRVQLCSRMAQGLPLRAVPVLGVRLEGEIVYSRNPRGLSTALKRDGRGGCWWVEVPRRGTARPQEVWVDHLLGPFPPSPEEGMGETCREQRWYAWTHLRVDFRCRDDGRSPSPEDITALRDPYLTPKMAARLVQALRQGRWVRRGPWVFPAWASGAFRAGQ